MALNSPLPRESQPAPGAARCPRDGAGAPGHPPLGTAVEVGDGRKGLLGCGNGESGATVALAQTAGDVVDSAPITAPAPG